MASTASLSEPGGEGPSAGAAMQQGSWRGLSRLSSGAAAAERFLADAGYDRAPWLAVALASGIGAWFILPTRWEWLALLTLLGAVGFGTLALLRRDGAFPYLRQSLATLALTAAAGCLTIWSKSALVGAPPLSGPLVTTLRGTVESRSEQPAEGRVRLVIVTRMSGESAPVRVRINVPAANDVPGASPGASVRMRARLMRPAAPMLPGAYDFARTAWFAGLAATGSALDPVEVIAPGTGGGTVRRAQAALAEHVRAQLPGSAGGIAAALASGDRGAITKADEQAMRDSGLSHLLSISGLHVSAVIAAAYVLALRVLALWPWLALRVRLPLVAAATGAGAGLAYTLLTGAEVPTVRSCIGGLLVLFALALGREPLSLRMLAVAAGAVMLLWPEAVVGPSFQLSFAAVLAIVALHGAAPVRAFLAPREEPWWARGGRRLIMLLGTGLLIEAALMPIGMFHFHRAGAYGAFANVIAIPLTTFVTMPLVAIALVLDVAGLGAPVWWLTGVSIDLLLGLARWTSQQPGAVTVLPSMGRGAFALFVVGGLWLALWRGPVRLWGVVPALLGALALTQVRAPDVLISGDGRHVGVTDAARERLAILRPGRSDYARDNLSEIAGMNGAVGSIAEHPDAECSADFCVLPLRRGEREWVLLMSRGKDVVPERALAAACARSDIVVADRWLPGSCKPRMLKADRNLLGRTGGLTLDLERGRITFVAQSQGEHGWWHEPEALRRRYSVPAGRNIAASGEKERNLKTDPPKVAPTAKPQ